MKKLLRKRLLFLVALLVGLGMPVMAQTATKSFVKDDYDNKRISGKIDDVVSYDAVSGTNNFNAPSVGRGGSGSNRYYFLTLNAYYYSDRYQGHNNLIISSEDGYLIEKVIITAISNDYVGGTISATATKDGVSVGNPTASTSQAVITISVNGADNVEIYGTSTLNISSIQVEYYSETPVQPTISITASPSTITVGGTSQLTVSGSDGAKTYSSNNTSVATVDANGLVTAKGAGTATITVNIAATQTYAAASASIQITVNAAPTTPDTEEPEVLDGYGTTVYYIRNVSTGLYIKYGGSYGMDAIEGRAAHPFKLYLKGTDSEGNNIYSLASIHGYFNSMYSNASLFIDRPEGESNWTFELVENTSDVYYLRGENGYALASVGNQYGILELRKYDTKDIYQKWQLITEDKLFAEMQGATVANPVDITPVIKGAAFDYADVVEVEEGTPFAPEVRTTLGLPTPPTGEGYREPTYSYVNYWEGFMAFAHYAAMWSDDPYVGSNTNLNGIGLSRNNIRNERVIEQFIEIPLSAGTYTFSYQGFYDARTGVWGELSLDEDEKPTMSIVAVNESDLSENTYTNTLKKYTDSSIKNLINSSASDKGYYVAGMLRDNRENDSYRDAIQFTLTENAIVGFRIHKPRTSERSGGSKCQWLVAFDDFTLVYQGNDNSTLDQAVLYYDRVKEAYLYYSKKVSELGEPASYPDPDTDTECHLDGCVHWTAWKNAIDGVVSVNGVDVYGDPATVTIPTENNKIAYLNGKADINKIDTEKEFLEALSKIEAAYQAAYAEHLSHATDITKETISDPSFENGGSGWTIGHDGSVATISGQTGEGLHGSKMYTTGNNGQNTWTGPVSQVITGLAPGLYSLQASFATAGNTAYLVANGYYSGVSSSSFDTFVDHELLFLVETTQDVRIAAVGHNNPYAVDYPLYGPHYWPGSGSSFRVDNFRLKRVADLPQGRVQLALADVDAIQIDDYAKEAAFADENSLQAYRINTYTDDAAAKTAVADIYARFRNTVKAQRTKNADMTYAIADPSFEHGIADAWEFSEFTSTDWNENGFFAEDRFIFTGSTGRKVFNTYQGGNGSGPISQTITGIPNGTYRVTAVMASDQNVAVLTANGVKSPAEALYTGDNNIGKLISVETQVTDHTLEISAEAKDGKWYKVDNFRLTFLHNKLALDHADTDVSDVKADWYTDVDLLRPMTNVTWNSFVVPYNMPVPENWDVRELTDGSINGTHVSMTFARVSEMKAGVPYMVRYYPQGVPEDPALDVNNDDDPDNDDKGYENKDERVTYTTLEGKNAGTISSEYTDVDFSVEATSGEKEVAGDAGTGTLEFVGSYVPKTIPEGAIFISNNNFYVSKGTSTIKGYRGYIVPKGAAANARTFGMRTRGGDSTDIESANNGEVTVVGIYDVNGMKLGEMQDGINILRMSDGTTIKILMK